MKSGTKILLQYIRKQQKTILTGMLAALALNILSTLFLFLLQFLSQEGMVTWERKGAYLILTGFGAYIILYTLMDNIYLSRLNQVEMESVYTIRKDIYHHLLHIKYQYFTKKHFGELNTNMIQDLEMLGDLVFKQLPRSLSELIYFFIAFVILLCTDVRLTLALLGFITLFTVYTLALKCKMQKYAGIYARSREELNTVLDDYVNKIKVLQFYGKTEDFSDRIDILNRDMNKNWLKLNIFGPLIQSSIEFAALACYLLIYGIGGNLLFSGTLTGSALFLFLSYIPQIWDKYSAVLDIYTSLVQGQVYSHRVFGGWGLEVEKPEKSSPVQMTSRPDSVYLKDVEFWYEPGQPVLQRFSFSFTAAGLYCIAGPSGSGKSTLFDLLLGFYAPCKGDIRIGNAAPETIRNLPGVIGLVHQDAYMINGNIIENIQFGDLTITQEQILEFLQDNRFLEILPVELTRPICRGSGILTTGMRRIVSLARTMLRRPEIILFDEVTAGLDSHTEQVILNYIWQLSQNKICIMVSHKPEDGIYAKEIIQIKSLA
ncbi:putative ABC transporter ATP-binding protein [Lachnospiraceae bacterium]|nr:putative ABC transporter ATP-binding protein [Lachnospiraceae bacterium]